MYNFADTSLPDTDQRIHYLQSEIRARSAVLLKPLDSWSAYDQFTFISPDFVSKSLGSLRIELELVIRTGERLNTNLNRFNSSCLMTIQSTVPLIDFSSNTHVIIPKIIRQELMGASATDAVLYKRRSFMKQINFIEIEVIKKGFRGWILGPPGTGKSHTSLAAALELFQKGWHVTWIVVSRDGQVRCSQFTNGSQNISSFKFCEETLRSHIDHISSDESHLVCIDGYVSSDHGIDEIYFTAVDCVARAGLNWRLLITCSMSARQKANDFHDRISLIKECIVCSWTLDEYLAAIKDSRIWQQLELIFGEDGQSIVVNEPKARLAHFGKQVKSKFYLAGGSSRWMFEYSAHEIRDKIRMSLDSVGDYESFCKNAIGLRSNFAVNRLFGSYETTTKNDQPVYHHTLISEYAAVELGLRVGPQSIQFLARSVRNDSNPSFDGWIFEMWFFSSIRNKGYSIPHEPLISDIFSIPLTSFSVAAFDRYPDVFWLKPIDWNQGGYDAVFINRLTARVVFVQVTAAIKHDLKLCYFKDFLMALRRCFVISQVDIFFVIPNRNLKTFKISKILDTGDLTEYGWPKGKEKLKVQIHGIDYNI